MELDSDKVDVVVVYAVVLDLMITGFVIARALKSDIDIVNSVVVAQIIMGTSILCTSVDHEH